MPNLLSSQHAKDLPQLPPLLVESILLKLPVSFIYSLRINNGFTAKSFCNELIQVNRDKVVCFRAEIAYLQSKTKGIQRDESDEFNTSKMIFCALLSLCINRFALRWRIEFFLLTINGASFSSRFNYL